ncbi:Small heat shock protein C2 [Ananas comosus]|uniref:Small heat shock protein C2 n=1 Tax=Ananas comosus TaxID=4615 RepID=A0A199USR4_ANACO|nr:Small heat shock protein C2 [Ananas comosus]
MTSRLCNSGVETLNDAPPQFARQGKIEKLQQASVSTGAMFSSEDCCDWSPRMDVAETGANYVVTVELPGVRISDILVEVDEQNLTVTGERSIQQQTVQIYPENCRPKYHQKQILQGPYRVVWALPNDANKDNVTAKFVDGFLHITFPKV